MAKLNISRNKLPDVEVDQIEIYPDGDKSRPRIGVLKFNKGMSNLVLDEGQLPYQSMSEDKR